MLSDNELKRLCGTLSLVTQGGADGEILAAAHATGRFLNARGLDWYKLLAPLASSTSKLPVTDWRKTVKACLRKNRLLNDWEWDFLCSIRSRHWLTEGQSAKLADIAEKAGVL